ncbi:MAG: hypothetical protein AAGG44_07925 [Planctomycetota bacterium]
MKLARSSMKMGTAYKLGIACLALCVVVASSGIASAQRGGEGGGRGGRGGQGGGQGGGRGGFGGFGGRGGNPMADAPALEFMNLLRIKEVREDDAIAMDEEVWEAISERQSLDIRALFRMSEEERKEALEEANDDALGVMEEVLDPDQQKRLMGLYVQQRGVGAVSNKMVAEEVGLDEDDSEKVSEGLREIQNEMRESMRERFTRGGDGGGGAGGDFREVFTKMREEMNEKSEKVLKDMFPKAYDKLMALKGEKFEFPERQFGGRGGPGGAGGNPFGGRGGDAGGRGGRGGEAGGRGGRGGGEGGRGGRGGGEGGRGGRGGEGGRGGDA